MRALLTPEIAPRMGIVLFRPGSELMPLFMQGRVLLEPEPERYSSFASGAVPAASQPLADDPAVRAVFRNEAVIRRAGGVECLESWLLREKGCQWPHSDWHSENMTTMRHAPGAIRLCWHCDNQLRDQFTERLNASIMLGYVSDAMKVVDSAVSDAARLLQGDISVLLPPPSSGKNFVEQVQKMWRTGKRLYGNASDLVTMIKTLSGVSLGSDLQPRGVWKTDSKTTATATQQRNVVASTLRTTAISEAAYAVTRLPAPTTSAVMQNSAVGQATTPAQSTGWPSVTHPALNNAPAVKNTVDLPTWEELTDIRDTLNTAIDKELSRTTSDALFLALRRVKADLNADINTRLEQSARIIQRTPDEVLPALVLAATWFDNAARDADIIRRNAITHPGFVPVIPLKVPVQ